MDSHKDRVYSSTFVIVAAAFVLYALSGGFRAIFGILIRPVMELTGVSYEQAGFTFGVAQLLYLGLMVGGSAGALCFGMIMGLISPLLGAQLGSRSCATRWEHSSVPIWVV